MYYIYIYTQYHTFSQYVVYNIIYTIDIQANKNATTAGEKNIEHVSIYEARSKFCVVSLPGYVRTSPIVFQAESTKASGAIAPYKLPLR